VCYWLTPDEYHDLIVAIIAGVQLVYLCYVLFHLLRTVDIHIMHSAVIPALFLLYIAFIVWTAVHALQNRNEIFTHFFVGAAFPVALSFIGGFRQYMTFLKVRDGKSIITPEVTQRIDELEFANTSKDKFFSIIAHDLKSPIGSIKTISEIYSEEAAQSKDNHAVELAAALRESIDGLCALLDDLLTWSRSQSGALQFLPTYIDIETLVDNVKKVTKPLCDTKSIALKVSINERDKLYGDQNMLRTVLRNLITNAIKYSYNNSVIRLDFDVEGYYSVIKVTDNGIGMNKEELNDLFQLDKLTSRPGTNKEAGNGLGLIVCNDFVEKHGGTITVEAEEDLGTTFVVKIPYARYMNKN
jgi:signal transduction histidine kinase